MEIIYLNETDSTHLYLKNHIKNNGYKFPLAIVAKKQTNGLGSRNNKWHSTSGNLFFSFVLPIINLPKDVPMQSLSIYFSYIMKEILTSLGSKTWLKWPNDFYINKNKIGGTITNITNDLIYCGIGINLISTNNTYYNLDLKIDIFQLLEKYFSALERYPSWKYILSQFKIEFYNNNNFCTNINDKKIILKDNMLQNDGSLLINNKKVFSLR